MAIDPKNDLWVFREGRQSVSTQALFTKLWRNADELTLHPSDKSSCISALMRAGEFETGLADANSAAHPCARQLTDLLALAFLGDFSELGRVNALFSEINSRKLPEFLSISPPEGFAYYALHPHDFARLAERANQNIDSALVIGIRSIGTTLSAIVRAALIRRGKKTERITVRPTGHPYDRVVNYCPEHLRSIADWNDVGASFLVVDEGPGRSGSSFLSVAEALTQANVPNRRITLLGSRPVDVNQLCAKNASPRWSQFNFLWPEPVVYSRFSDHLYIGGGDWRHHIFSGDSNWPACWPQMERLKFLSPDRRRLYKFDGFGRFGEEVLARAQILAETGFGCSAEDASDGMICYPVIAGRAAQPSDLSPTVLTRLASYCAMRTAEFRCTASPPTQLPAMLGFNVQQEFGIELGSETDVLSAPAPILADGRMQPHEWILPRAGALLKVDACTHGDDHFFPGPTDIAWDLAGAIIEWNLNQSATDFLLSEFHRLSGIDRSGCMATFILAHAVFRLAYWKMALSTVVGSAEEQRVVSAFRHYRSLAAQQLANLSSVRNQAIKMGTPAAELSVSSTNVA